MPGASEEARRVKIMNANWIAGADGDEGDFELMIVTTDDRQHVGLGDQPAGAISTIIYAQLKHWTAIVPTTAWVGGLAAAILIGAIAGLLPAIRAAQLSPTDALRTV